MRTLISIRREWPRSPACRLAMGMLMARSPAIFRGPGALAGNESTSVALFLPRNCRFSRRIVASVVSKTVTWPRNLAAACASRRKRARVRAVGMHWFRGWALWAGPADRLGSFTCKEGSGSRSGSRRIIVREAATFSGPVSSIFYANFEFTAVWQDARPVVAPAVPLAVGSPRQGSTAVLAAVVLRHRRREQCAEPARAAPRLHPRSDRK